MSSPQSPSLASPGQIPGSGQELAPAQEFARARPGSWSPSTRLGALVAAGVVWLVVGWFWFPVAFLAGAWWIALFAAGYHDRRALREARELGARRALSPVLSLGARNPVELVLRSHCASAFHCAVEDEPPLDFTADADTLTGGLPAGGETRLRYHVTPPKRGNFVFGTLHVRLTTSLGLLQRQLHFDLTEPAKVYPRLTDIAAQELALRKGREIEVGLHLARLKGVGLDFESLRDYQPGDEIRRIDWKATARHGEPFTREYEVERSQHVVICLDLGRTMASQLGLLSKMDHAINAAALLAHVATGLGDWVGVYAFAQEAVVFLPPRKHHFSQVLDSLYALQAQPVESDYHHALLEARHRLRKRSLAVLLTDLPDPDSSARLISSLRLLTGRHLVLCAALSDYELHELAARTPSDPRQMYERTVATALLADRQRALRAVEASGALALDVTAADLSLKLLNRYLDIKAKGRL